MPLYPYYYSGGRPSRVFDVLSPPGEYLEYDEGDGVGAAWDPSAADNSREMQRTFNFLTNVTGKGRWTLKIPGGDYTYSQPVFLGRMAGLRIEGGGGVQRSSSTGHDAYRHDTRLIWNSTTGTAHGVPEAWASGRNYWRYQHVTVSGISYRCLQYHVSGSLSEPGVGGSWTSYWVRDPEDWHVVSNRVQYYGYVVHHNGTYYRCFRPHTTTKEPGTGTGDLYWEALSGPSLPCFTMFGCDGLVFDGIAFRGKRTTTDTTRAECLILNRSETGIAGGLTSFWNCTFTNSNFLVRTGDPFVGNSDLLRFHDCEFIDGYEACFQSCYEQNMDFRFDSCGFLDSGWALRLESGGCVYMSDVFTNKTRGLVYWGFGAQNTSGIHIWGWKTDDSDKRRRVRWYYEAEPNDLDDKQGRTRGTISFAGVTQSQGQGLVSGTLTSITNNGSGKCRLTFPCPGTDGGRIMDIRPGDTILVAGCDINDYNGIHTIPDQASIVADANTMILDTDVDYDAGNPTTPGTWKDGHPLFRLRGGGSVVVHDSTFDVGAIDSQRMADMQPGNWLVSGSSRGLACHLDVLNCKLQLDAAFASPPNVETEYLNMTDPLGVGIQSWYNFEGIYQDREPSGAGSDDTTAPWSQSNWKAHMTLAQQTALNQIVSDWENGGRLDLLLDAAVADADTAQKIAEADLAVDTSTTPWQLVWIQKGTGALGVGTELMRKRLFDTAGDNITSATTAIGRQTT